MVGIPNGTNCMGVGPLNSEICWRKGDPKMGPKG